MKSCTQCGETDPTKFHKLRTGKDGLHAWCKSCRSKDNKVYRTRNAKAIAPRLAEYRKEHAAEIREYNRVYGQEYRQTETGRAVERSKLARRRAAKLKRTPSWLTKEEKSAIKAFYKNCPKGYHVDHIIPLQGENVSGLHVLCNLQYLSFYENSRKNNQFDGTPENEGWRCQTHASA